MRPSLAIALLGLLGCGGSDGNTLFAAAGDGGARPDGALPTDAGADAVGTLPDGTAPLPDLDAKCLGGPTGRQLLALLLPTYRATFHSAVDQGGSTPLTLGVAYVNGAVGCAPGQTLCPPGGGHGCYTTDPSVSLVVNATFRTADGAFGESLSGTVTWSPSSPDQIAWSARLPASQLAGTFTPTLSTRANVTIAFAAQLSQTGTTSGSVDEIVGSTSGGGGFF